MTHSGFGFISPGGAMELPSDLLEILSLNFSNDLYAAFYPPPKEKIGYENTTMSFDFMVTPVPYKYWSVSGRLLARLNHVHGSLNEISTILLKHEASIIHSESARSGHRYGSLSFHIAFENLLKEITSANYDLKTNAYKKTFTKLKALHNDLRENCKSLFSVKNDIDLKVPLTTSPNTGLAYFYQNYLAASDDHKVLNEPFCLRNSINPSSGKFTYDIKDKLKEISDCNNYLSKGAQSILRNGAVIFANLETRYANIRMVAIPNEELFRFFILIVKYNIHPNSKCQGIIWSISNCFKKNIRIWWSTNSPKSTNKSNDEGHVMFFLENTNIGHLQEYYRNDIDEVIEKINTLNNDKKLKENGLYYIEGIVEPITFAFAKAKLEVQSQQNSINKFDNDIFICYSEKDSKIAKKIHDQLCKLGIKCFYNEIRKHVGNQFPEKILSGLLNSREICLIWTENAKESHWVTSEWSIAWAQKKIVTPISISEYPFEKLDNRIQSYSGITLKEKNKKILFSNKDLDKYAEDILLRRYQEFIIRSWK